MRFSRGKRWKFSAILSFAIGCPISGWPAGKAPASTEPLTGGVKPPVCEFQASGARPIRRVVLKPVGTVPFRLPNGGVADLSADLNALLETAVTGTDIFAPTDPGGGPADPCAVTLELRAKVSTFDLNVWQFGVTFGYTTTGARDSGISNVTGNVDVKISLIAMEFGIWQCAQGICQQVAASSANQNTAGVSASVKVDFGAVVTGPTLIYNSPLGNALRSIMADGMSKLARSPRISELAWQATIREVQGSQGMVTFDAGSSSRIAPKQSFVVYAAQSSGGGCGVFKAVAEVQTDQVFPVSSTALVQKILDQRGIQMGDVVMALPVAGPVSSAK